VAANNDGQMDELLYMTGLLARRLSEITATRSQMFAQMQQAGQDVSNFAITPNLNDVMMSHTLLPTKTYRPYVTTTFQYLKHRVTTGSQSLGSESTFQMRTFGEFLSDSLLYVQTSAVNSADVSLQTLVLANLSTWLPPNTTQSVSPSTGVVTTNYSGATIGTMVPLFNGTTTGIQNPAAAVGVGTGNWVFGGTTPVTGTTNLANYNTIEDSQGNVLMDRDLVNGVGASSISANITTLYPTTILVRDYVCYADFPLHAMITAVAFQINSTSIDSYTQERDNFHILYMLPTNKVASYYKCVGQELAVSGYSGLITNYTVPSNVTIPGYPTGSIVAARQRTDIMVGYQTPQYALPVLTGIYPNKFDHCRDVNNAIPILAIPNTDRTFLYTFAPQSQVVYSVPANLYAVQTQIAYNNIYTPTTPAGAGPQPTSIVTTVNRTPLTVGGTIGNLALTQLQMYINNLFVDPSVHDIYLERIGFSLTRVHRTQSVNINTSLSETTLTSFKWPLEFMFIGLRPASNLTVSPWTNWWKFTYNTPMTGSLQTKHKSVVWNGLTNATGTFLDAFMPQTSINNTATINYQLQARTIDTLQITLQTIALYDTTDQFFFNAYLPYEYGGYNITGASENSSLFVTFNFYPNDNGSPNGHVNVSRSREFVVNINSSVVGSGLVSSTGTLQIVGIVINFWVASSGNLFLRFT